LLAEDRGDVQELLLDDVIVPDVRFSSRERFARECVHTVGFLVLEVRLLDLD